MSDALTPEPPSPPGSPSEPGSVAAYDRELEATGETVGEAKWSALRELERRFPGFDKASVEFVVVSEGERGLLGVGYAPARVIARLTRVPEATPAAEEEPGSPAARLRELLERVTTELGAAASIRIGEDEDTLTATLSGPDVGLVIGRRGQTIDAIQHLANAIVWRGTERRKEVVVDAAGYRERRRGSLERVADRAAADALRSRQAVALEPMTAVERKIVHLRLRDRPDVSTASEGTEPSRHVVVRPTVE
jgi:spoIIIJ-associated protein